MSGEQAGDPRYELLREPLSDFLEDTEALAYRSWRQYQGGRSLFSDLTGFTSGLMAARAAARLGQYRRADMPVIDEVDLDALKADLLRTGVAVEPNCSILVKGARPSQCQVYADKAILGTARSGVDGTIAFLKANHLVITQDDFIVDGHHRWLSAWMIDGDLELPAFRIPEDYVAARPEIMAFSDSRHPRNL